MYGSFLKDTLQLSLYFTLLVYGGGFGDVLKFDKKDQRVELTGSKRYIYIVCGVEKHSWKLDITSHIHSMLLYTLISNLFPSAQSIGIQDTYWQFDRWWNMRMSSLYHKLIKINSSLMFDATAEIQIYLQCLLMLNRIQSVKSANSDVWCKTRVNLIYNKYTSEYSRGNFIENDIFYNPITILHKLHIIWMMDCLALTIFQYSRFFIFSILIILFY